MRLSVLDQSPIIQGSNARRAVEETLALARRADELGYHRYWLAEHHAIAALADPSPEILAARVASATSRIRVGTGGVLMPYYSPLKIAEQFRMLEALFPGRIDLGLGRAPGGDPRTALALMDGEYPGAERMPQQIRDLVGFLDAALPSAHPYAKVRAQPAGATSPEIWVLGSSDYGGALAAQLGLRFAFAHFISAFGGEVVARAYRQQYEPSERAPGPYSLVCAFVICAKTRAEAGPIDHPRSIAAAPKRSWRTFAATPPNRPFPCGGPSCSGIGRPGRSRSLNCSPIRSGGSICIGCRSFSTRASGYISRGSRRP